MSDEPRNPSDTGTTDPAPDSADKKEHKGGRTYTEEQVQEKLRGSGKEINRLLASVEALTAELASAKAEAEGVKGKAKELEQAKGTVEQELAKARTEAARQRAFLKIADQLAPDVEIDWLPTAALALDDKGKPTAEATKALEEFLQAKPTLARKAGGSMPPATRAAGDAGVARERFNWRTK